MVFVKMKEKVIEVPSVLIAISVWNSPLKNVTTLRPECLVMGRIFEGSRCPPSDLCPVAVFAICRFVIGPVPNSSDVVFSLLLLVALDFSAEERSSAARSCASAS